MIYQTNKILIVEIPEFSTKFEISHSDINAVSI